MNNPSAFPIAGRWTNAESRSEPGMTLRDYFAAAALQGLIACQLPGPTSQKWLAEFAHTSAYQFADAMLAERAK